MNTILKARFVNFGDKVAVVLLFSESVPKFLDEYCGNGLYLSRKLLDYYRAECEKWLETLNSSDAPVPRIENNVENDNFDVVYITPFSDGKILRAPISFGQKAALEILIGQDFPIYKPKKFTANWKQIYPRECKVDEVVKHLTVGHIIAGVEDAVATINQLQKAEAGEMEVWELTVTETN